MKNKTTTVFESQASEYDLWFDNHPELFQNECKVLLKAIPNGMGVEIGVGTGRFAEALKIPVGVEPAHAMAQMAIARGINVVKATAEELPFHGQSFDFALMVTTVCFLNDVSKAFSEAHRVLKKNGNFIIGMIDRESYLGMKYETQKTTNPWYRDAYFHSVKEITDILEQADFTCFEYWQTLLSKDEKIEEPQPGFGLGGFIVIKADKK